LIGEDFFPTFDRGSLARSGAAPHSLGFLKFTPTRRRRFMPGSKRLLLTFMVLLIPSPGWSQDLSTELPVGSRIRVGAQGQETIGRLRVLWTDSLELGPEGGLPP
jgi:hypothetical protein